MLTYFIVVDINIYILRTVANRLDKEHANICNEIELETKVLEKLTETFNVAEYVMINFTYSLEQKKFNLLL